VRRSLLSASPERPRSCLPGARSVCHCRLPDADVAVRQLVIEGAVPSTASLTTVDIAHSLGSVTGTHPVALVCRRSCLRRGAGAGILLGWRGEHGTAQTPSAARRRRRPVRARAGRATPRSAAGIGPSTTNSGVTTTASWRAATLASTSARTARRLRTYAR
jgi:hypothetical protein